MRIESVPVVEKPVDRTQIGFGGRFLIWTLAVLVYGGGLGCWFVLADRVDQLLGLSRDTGDSDRGQNHNWWADLPGMSEIAEATSPDSSEGVQTRASAKQRDDWPSVKVVGVMAQKGGSGAAILDGEIIPIGASHAGVKVIAVDQRQVTLEYKGDVQSFYPGSFTR